LETSWSVGHFVFDEPANHPFWVDKKEEEKRRKSPSKGVGTENHY
jgi:hypothetical protein